MLFLALAGCRDKSPDIISEPTETAPTCQGDFDGVLTWVPAIINDGSIIPADGYKVSCSETAGPGMIVAINARDALQVDLKPAIIADGIWTCTVSNGGKTLKTVTFRRQDGCFYTEDVK